MVPVAKEHVKGLVECHELKHGRLSLTGSKSWSQIHLQRLFTCTHVQPAIRWLHAAQDSCEWVQYQH